MKGLPKIQVSHPGASFCCSRVTECQLSQDNYRIQCCYINRSPQIQIVRIATVCSGFFERVVWPSARVMFEAYRDDHLEIHMGSPISAILSDRIPCHRLAYQEEYIG